MAGKVLGPKGKPTTVVLLNSPIAKLHYKYLRWYPQMCATLNLGPKSCFLDWTAVNAEAGRSPETKRQWVLSCNRASLPTPLLQGSRSITEEGVRKNLRTRGWEGVCYLLNTTRPLLLWTHGSHGYLTRWVTLSHGRQRDLWSPTLPKGATSR